MSHLIEHVYKQIIEKIPESEPELKINLNKFMESIWNKPPEVRSGLEVYLPFAHILAQHIQPHESNFTGWKKDVVDIFNTNTNNKTVEYEEDMSDFDYMHHTMTHY